MERLPGDALRVDGPVLVALCVATVGAFLRGRADVGLREPRADFLEFVSALRLEAEMINAGLRASVRNGEVDARVFKHPLGVVRLLYCGLATEERGIEADALLQVIDGDVHVEALHDPFLSRVDGGRRSGQRSSSLSGSRPADSCFRSRCCR